MRKWIILITILAVGIATAFVMLFIVSKTPAPETGNDTGTKGFVSFFGRQFGFINDEPNDDTTSGTSTPTQRPTFRARLALEKMIPVSPDMVSGITFTASTTASSTIESARYVFRETGRIEDLSLETGDTKRLTNTTVPRIQEASFGPNGSGVILRYLSDDNETIETFIAPLPTDPFASSTELIGSFLKENIPSIVWSPEGRAVFYLSLSDSAVSGYLFNLINNANNLIFSSPLKEWTASWEASDALLLTTKPSYLALGTAVRVTTAGKETPLITGKSGLTTLPNPSMTRVLYSQSNSQSTHLYIYDTASRATDEILLPTLPEKCVWADDIHAVCAVPKKTGGNLPDAWYQGTVTFSDTFWLFDAESGQVDFLFDPSETPAQENVDAVNLVLSHDNTVLGFLNKKDLRGWVADLSEWFPL